jgi:hypothetical protein
MITSRGGSEKAKAQAPGTSAYQMGVHQRVSSFAVVVPQRQQPAKSVRNNQTSNVLVIQRQETYAETPERESLKLLRRKS